MRVVTSFIGLHTEFHFPASIDWWAIIYFTVDVSYGPTGFYLGDFFTVETLKGKESSECSPSDKIFYRG